MRRQFLASAIGGLLLLGGGAVMGGWLLRFPLWESVFASGTAMVFSAALCFALAGIGLAAPRMARGRVRPVRLTMACALAAVALLALGEMMFAIAPGIDLAALHRWYPDDNPHPGRMAPNAAVAFLLAGAALALGGAGKRFDALSHALPAATATLGLIGLAGHTPLFDLTYSGYDVSRMPPVTAAGLMLLGAGLMLDQRDAAEKNGAGAVPAVADIASDKRIHAFFGVAVTVLAMGVFISYGSISGLIEQAGVGAPYRPVEQERELQKNTAATATIILVGNVAGFVILFFAAWLLKRQNDLRGRLAGALQDSNVFLDSLVEHIPDMIFVKDADNLRFVRFNRAGEELLGLPRAEMLGKSDHDLLPREKADAIAAADRAALAGNAVVDTAEEPVHTRGKGLRVLHTVKIPIRDKQGRPRYLLGIATDITEHKLAMQELERSQQELRALSRAANEAMEAERRGTARELHDELGQTLTALKMDAAWLMERLPSGQEALMEKLTRMLAILDGMTAATRRIAANLRPLILDDLGLIPAIEWLAESFGEHSGIYCRLTIADPGLDLPEPYATAVFRILQESLTNVSRHAHASLVEISISREEGEISLTVRDNGRGFVSAGPRKPDSHGLIGLRERAYLVGGEFRIDSEPGRGTVINLRIPINQPPAAENQDFCV